MIHEIFMRVIHITYTLKRADFILYELMNKYFTVQMFVTNWI